MSKYIKKAINQISDEYCAVEKLYNDIYQKDMAGAMFFCSSFYDLNKIENAINHFFDCEIVGCTTAGEIMEDYHTHGIIGVSFSSEQFAFHSACISDVLKFDYDEAQEISTEFKRKLKFNDDFDVDKMFTFLLNDGMTMQEEKVTSLIHKSLNGINLFGGSAGDDFKFKNAPVFVNKKFQKNSSSVVLIESKLKFKIYKIQHFAGSDKDLVITGADSSSRIVHEINGSPAASELAEIIGVDKNDLMNIYSNHPLMLQIGSEWYVRTVIEIMGEDLRFACAIDEGIPLTVGEITGLTESLEENIKDIESEFSDIELTFGCECIHRMLKINEIGLKDKVIPLLSRLNFIGFVTYGEQYNSVHLNQTLTCVVIGK